MTRQYGYVLTSSLSGVLGAIIAFVVMGFFPKQKNGAWPVASAPLTVSTGAAVSEALLPEDSTDVTNPRLSLRQLGDIAESLALADPEAAVKRAMEIPGHDNREAYLGAALRTWGEKDGERAAMWSMDYFKGEQLTDALYFVADGWAEADPEEAAVWYQKNTEGSVLDDAMWEALESWGRKDPAAAFAWSANLDDYVKSTAMQGLAEGWGAVDPEGAIEAGMQMGSTDYGYKFLTSVMTQWAGSSPEKAATWAVGLVNEQLRSGVLNELGETWAQTDPEKAAEWVSGIKDPGSRRFAEGGLAIGWSEHDPGGAIEWALSSITEAGQRDEMIGDITFNWTNLDPRGAVKWLKAQPPGPRADQVLKAFSREISDDDPEASVSWAAKISDPLVRDQEVRSLLKNWVDTHGETAKTQVQKMDLPEALKKEYAPAAN